MIPYSRKVEILETEEGGKMESGLRVALQCLPERNFETEDRHIFLFLRLDNSGE